MSNSTTPNMEMASMAMRETRTLAVVVIVCVALIVAGVCYCVHVGNARGPVRLDENTIATWDKKQGWQVWALDGGPQGRPPLGLQR